jgi:hypothetical protein
MRLHSKIAIFTFLNKHSRMHSINSSSTSIFQSYLNYTGADRKFGLCGYREQRGYVNSINPSKTKTALLRWIKMQQECNIYCSRKLK